MIQINLSEDILEQILLATGSYQMRKLPLFVGIYSFHYELINLDNLIKVH